MSLKPIKIIKIKGGYHVFVNGTPIVEEGGKASVDRIAAGFKVSKSYKPPKNTQPFVFTKAGEAAHMAHLLGRYIMKLGDMVFAYTELVNIPGNHEAWWSRAVR